MAKTQQQALIYQHEKLIGLRAARMTEQYLHAVIRQRLHIHNKGLPEEPILEATDVKAKMGDYRLLGLNLMSSKTAFILNFGFTGVREATTVYFNASRYKVGKTQRKRHQWSLPAFNIFEDIYYKSGAVDYLVTELTKTRTEALQLQIDGLVLKFNSQNNGQ